MNLDLSNKRALVCGSSRGIGKACAVELAELGASITLFARDHEALRLAQAELNTARGQDHHVLAADFSRPEAVLQAISGYVASGAAVEILVNNTGGPPPGPAHTAEAADYLTAFRMHLVSSHHLVQAVLPAMKAAGYGRIVNIISTSVKQPIPGLGVSNTVRGAMASWSKTLAGELGGFGITVNNVLPGSTATARLHEILSGRARKTGVPLEAIEEEARAGIPAGRFGSPEEIASAVAFLASPAAAYVNGISLPVDGGRTGAL